VTECIWHRMGTNGVEGFCEHGNDFLGTIKGEKFLDYCLVKVSAPWR
jgi:hypothetical protein